MSYTLATAAEAAKVSKPTLWRWVKSGKVSATKGEDGTYRIEPAELHRYLDSVATTSPETHQAKRSDALADMDAKGLQEAVALRFEVEKLKALLDTERQRVDELKEDREHWRDQAKRLAITHEKAITIAPVAAPIEERRGGMFGRMFGRG